MKKIYLLISFLIIIFPVLTFAQTPELIADFNPGTEDGFNEYNFEGITVGNNLIFPLVSNELGEELGVLKDNTLSILKDLNPGEKSSEPDNFVLFNDKIYFSAYDETNGGCIWTTDGTAENTQILFSFEQSSEKPQGLTVSESGWLYYSCNDILYRTDGNTNKKLFSGVDFEMDYTSQSFSYSLYKNEIAFLVKCSDCVELYSVVAGEASLLTTLSGTSRHSYVFGLSKVSNGLIFGIRDSYNSTNTGTYVYSSANNAIAKITIADSYAKRIHDFSAEASIAWVSGQGYYMTNGVPDQENLLFQSSNTSSTQGTGILNGVYGGKMIFHASEGTWGDNYIVYTDGTTTGSSELFKVKKYLSNIIINDNYAFVASGTSNGYKPKLYRINMDDGSYENLYNFDEESFNSESILFLGVLNNKLYYISNLDQSVGRELYSISIGNSNEIFDYEYQAGEVDVFPNPVEKTLNIKSEKEEIIEVTIISSTGGKVFNREFSEKILQLDMQNLTSGIYFVNIVTGKNTTTKTIVKK